MKREVSALGIRIRYSYSVSSRQWIHESLISNSFDITVCLAQYDGMSVLELLDC